VLAGFLCAGASPEASATTTTLTFRSGPIHVDGYQTSKASNDVRTPPISGSIVAMDAQLVDGADRAIPQSQVMLHHLVFFNRGRRGTTGRVATRRSASTARSRNCAR
jgi:hypothetical protein